MVSVSFKKLAPPLRIRALVAPTSNGCDKITIGPNRYRKKIISERSKRVYYATCECRRNEFCRQQIVCDLNKGKKRAAGNYQRTVYSY